jgi:aminoglycoside phosphotransferase (APT) family kinase protein
VISACRRVGIEPSSVQLLRHFANAVFLVGHDPPVVARVAYNRGVIQRSRAAIAVTRWLVSQGFPATMPVDLPSGCSQPVVYSEGPIEAAVTFWRYYPQPASQSKPELDALAGLARALHNVDGLPPIPLPTYEPLQSMRWDAANSNLDKETLSWLHWRIDQLRDEYAQLDFPLGIGLIHGDMYAGNLLLDKLNGEFVLGDWDSVCTGPREVDLAPTFTAARFGLDPVSLDRFATEYGYDLRTWPGYSTLRSIRELSTLTALIRLAPINVASASELRYRISTLQGKDHTAIWQAQ